MTEGLFPIKTKNFSVMPGNMDKPMEDDWVITRKNGAENEIGRIRFNDAIFNGEVQINLDLDSSYNKAKYYEELYFAMARFVFRLKDIKEISTVCRHENDHIVRGLEKAGYVRRENKDGNDHYSMKKQKTSWTGFYIIIGMICGFMLGIIISNLWLGTISSVVIGAVIGFLMDKRVKE